MVSNKSGSFDQAYLKAVQALVELLDNTHTPYVVIGGLAVTLTAKPRFTEDIDIVIWVESSARARVMEQAGLHGFTPRVEKPLEFAAQTNMLLLKHDPTEIDIDLSCGALPFELEMIERARSIDLPGMTLRVATTEDLIITKAVALREQDVADIKTLIDASDALDDTRITHWLTQFAEVLENPEIHNTIKRMLDHPAAEKSPQKRKPRGRSR